MNRLAQMKEPLKPNGFGITWLGNLVEYLGVDFNNVQCRGSWDRLELDDDILSFTTETAWYRCTEVEDLIKKGNDIPVYTTFHLNQTFYTLFRPELPFVTLNHPFVILNEVKDFHTQFLG